MPMNSNRLEKLRHDPSHVDGVVTCLGRLVRRRAAERAYTKISVTLVDGIPTDVHEERRIRAEELDPELA